MMRPTMDKTTRRKFGTACVCDLARHLAEDVKYPIFLCASALGAAFVNRGSMCVF